MRVERSTTMGGRLAIVCVATFAFSACDGALPERFQPSLAGVSDARGRTWIVAGYTEQRDPDRSSIGIGVRSPEGAWQTFPPLAPPGGGFRPSADAWVAAAQNGSRAYVLSLLIRDEVADARDDLGDGLSLAVVDLSSGTPRIDQPRRIDGGAWSQWDEPTVVATRAAGAGEETVIVAGTPLGPDEQDLVAVLVSRDGGGTFGDPVRIRAPGYPGHRSGRPDNTVVRPFLRQDPRQGWECHAYMAFGVYYPTALTETVRIAAPSCASSPSGCRSIAETETHDCGATWSEPVYIAIDTGRPSGEDYRGFGYGIAHDGTRFVMFGDEAMADAPMRVKRARSGERFEVTRSVQGALTWDDGPMEVLATGPDADGRGVLRWRPTLAASELAMAFWVQERTDTHTAEVWLSTSRPSEAGQWTAPRLVDAAGTACDGALFPSDDYMGVTPNAPFARAAADFVVAWTHLRPCGSDASRRLVFRAVP